ncbi:MAG: hypothetical protein ABI042_09045 [Verrucomicrobiota bacterium]
MIEIAISLAVIAFALVAIIGVLPTGMTVQKDNREETIINQDGPFFLEAIRNGAKGLDYLTNHVDSITHRRRGTTNGAIIDETIKYTNAPGLFAVQPDGSLLDGSMTNGLKIIGLLSNARYDGEPTNPTNRVTNSISARVRALTGSATEQGQANPDFAFSYRLESEITPFITGQVPVSSTNYNFDNETPPLDLAQSASLKSIRTIEWKKVKNRETNTFEVRLIFKWPLFQNTNGPNRQSVRTLVTGSRTNVEGLDFFQPQSFVAATNVP